MEYIRKCNVCGKIYCYSDDDVNKNSSNAAMGALSALAGLGSAFGVTVFHTTQSVHLNSLSKSYTDKMIDFNKCPECNSTNTVEISLEEIKKIHNEERKNKKIEINSNASAESLIKRARIYLEDAEWDNANSYAEAVLDLEPENSVAYLIKLMSELNVKNENDLFNKDIIFEGNKLYTKIVRYSDEEFVRKFKEHDENLRKIIRDEHDKEIENNYQYALKLKEKAKTESEIRKAIGLFYQNSTYKNSKESIDELKDRLNIMENEKNYNDAKQYMGMGTIESYKKAINYFNDSKGWKDSKELIVVCRAKITEIKEEQEKKEKKIRIIGIAIISSIIIVVAIISIIKGFIIPNNKYNKAMNLIEEENYQSAINELEEIKFYKDSSNLIYEIEEKIELKEKYEKAQNAFDKKDFSTAKLLFEKLGEYQDSKSKLKLAIILYNIEMFASNESQIYFANNKEEFKLISDDETIRKLFTGKWYVRKSVDYGRYKNLGSVAVLNPDGTATTGDNYMQTSWMVKDGHIYIDTIWGLDKQEIEDDLYKREVRKIADGVFLLINKSSIKHLYGKAQSILISENSEYADYLK